MYETEISLGLIGSASVIYGFYLLYYTFARSGQLQERIRIYDSSPPRGKWMSRGEALRGLIQLEERRIKVGVLIIVASVFFEISVFGGLLWLAWQLPWAVAVSGLGFGFLAALAIPPAYFAMGKNLQEAGDELSKLRTEERRASSAEGPDGSDAIQQAYENIHGVTDNEAIREIREAANASLESSRRIERWSRVLVFATLVLVALTIVLGVLTSRLVLP